jgi:hypothetical protein
MASTCISSHIKAPRAAVYRALLEPQAVAAWRVPAGMTSTAVDRLYERGRLRIRLSKENPPEECAKRGVEARMGAVKRVEWLIDPVPPGLIL